ncbi:MAG: UDP-N-acetylmuramate--L-alanine ligase [Eubacterium sp.]|nr:UDP-N-acetylmuramate--L-alanine ligase [Eubacterium sp.]
MTDFLIGKNKIHFIGIGGSGMYPLAQILHSKGFSLTGSDNNMTDTITSVKKMGIPFFLKHDASNIGGADLIVYSAAIMKDNPELKAARDKNIETRERSELLGLVSSLYDNAVCISGTHGKTTASSMVAHIFLADNIDISAVIGGKLKAIGGSGKVGNSNIFICEACEFNDTFLKLEPNTALILNIDEDHMDYFKTMDNLIESFSKFCGATTDRVIYNGDDKNTVKAVDNSHFCGKKITFGWNDGNMFYPENINQISDFETGFTLMHDGLNLTDITIRTPGTHNILNAVAACAAAISCGCSLNSLKKGLYSFTGVGRRFERLYSNKGITIVDDYAHHPLEISAVLKTAKQMNFKRIIAVHQPFTYSRTAALLTKFAKALNIADQVILTPIMGGREVNTYGVTTEQLAEKIDGAQVINTFEEIAEYIIKYAKHGDLIITLGCGDINKAAKLIVNLLHTTFKK